MAIISLKKIVLNCYFSNIKCFGKEDRNHIEVFAKILGQLHDIQMTFKHLELFQS